MKNDFHYKSLGEIAEFEMGQSPPSSDVNEDGIGYPFLQGNAEFSKVYPEPYLYCSKPKKKCEPGDILISVRAPVGDLNLADQIFVIGRGLAAIRFTEVSSDIGWHILNYWARDLQKVAQGSTFKAISKSDLEKLKIILPPLPEQRRIAEILDTVDEVIRRTEQVIEKLKQIKQGLLHDLLTRGLDENDQIGEGNNNARKVRFSEVAEINPPKELKGVDLDTMVSFIPMEDVSNEGHWHNKQKRPLKAVRKGYSFFRENDVLFAKITPSMENGKGAIVEGSENSIGFGSTEFHVLRAKKPNVCKYIYYWTRTAVMRKKAESVMIGSAGQQRVKRHFFDDFTIPYLKPEVQKRVVAVLDTHDGRIKSENDYLDKMKKVRKGLMDDLLTGKVRVNVSNPDQGE
jgi:type I restriction enzyme S subunit